MSDTHQTLSFLYFKPLPFVMVQWETEVTASSSIKNYSPVRSISAYYSRINKKYRYGEPYLSLIHISI